MPASLNHQTSLYWFTSDLRLDDNPLLTYAAQSQQLICVYCVDPRWFEARRYHLAQMGPLRWQFLQEQLNDLKRQLALLGQKLFILYQEPEQAIVDLCRFHDVDNVFVARQFGYDEQQILNLLEQALAPATLHQHDQCTLFGRDDLKHDFRPLTAGYTPFKNRALSLLDEVKKPLSAPLVLPPGPKDTAPQCPLDLPVLAMPDSASPLFSGGETQAHHQLNDYLNTDALSDYKQTRDQLSGFLNSSKLSAWLNSGTLSCRRVLARIYQYEAEHGRNASTQWMVVELLWREYFHWLSDCQGLSLFRFKGLGYSAPLTSFYAERFKKWCQGTTPYPLVNACMRELKATGYLSNRGRQIAASCLVNELQLDWRFGAAWFEYQLLDYQVSVNWGNWQYIAGVGVDPRGGRHFNLAKQQNKYDADGAYITKWCGNEDFSKQGLDAVDAADWPVF